MKKFVLTMFIFTSLLFSEDKHSFIGLSLWRNLEIPNENYTINGLQLGINSKYKAVNGIDLNIIGSERESIKAFQLSLIGNVVIKNSKGIQLSLANVNGANFTGGQIGIITNIVNGNFTGGQIGIITNMVNGNFAGGQIGTINMLNGNFAGIQISLFANIVNKTVKGIQASPINIATELKGIQLGAVNITNTLNGLQTGVINIADTVHGIQFGLFNVADQVHGMQIGLINKIKSKKFFKYLPLVNFQYQF